MNKNELKIASISDVHLAHRNTPTSHILSNLYEAFPDNQETADLDIIFIAGDFFDRLLTYPDDDIVEIERFVVYLEKLCAKHDIVLRVLEGTRSHDWKQSSLFLRVAEWAKVSCDVQYFCEPIIEYLEKFDIHILYIPDEWDDDTNKTLNLVKDMMHARGLEKVDFAVMHGQFEYQLPEVVSAPKHDSGAYLDLVRYLIFIGHVHMFSNFERIYAQGSFDRLTHGDEVPKGHIRARVRKNGDYRITFVENKKAKIYKTISCSNLTLEETLAEIELKTRSIPDGSAIRIEVDKNNPILNEMGQLHRMSPLIQWSKKIKDTSDCVVQPVESFQPEAFVCIAITPDNISSLLLSRLNKKNVSAELITAAQKELDEIILKR